MMFESHCRSLAYARSCRPWRHESARPHGPRFATHCRSLAYARSWSLLVMGNFAVAAERVGQPHARHALVDARAHDVEARLGQIRLRVGELDAGGARVGEQIAA